MIITLSPSGLSIGGTIANGAISGAVLYVGASGVLAQAAITGLVKASATAPTAAAAGSDYVAPTGVAGGQTINGDTGASGNLTLNSTSNAALWNVQFQSNLVAIDPNGAIVWTTTNNTAIPSGNA